MLRTTSLFTTDAMFDEAKQIFIGLLCSPFSRLAYGSWRFVLFCVFFNDLAAAGLMIWSKTHLIKVLVRVGEEMVECGA